jgi:tetratricopeptide (TPR) repeat protein
MCEYLEAACQKVLCDDPQNVDAHMYLGDSHYYRINYAQAIQAYQDGLTIDPDSAYGHYSLGWAYMEMGDTVLAMQEYERLKELDPELAEDLLTAVNEHTSSGD